MVYGKRTLCKSLSGKDRQTNIIIRTAINKFGSHLLGSFQTIGLQVFCKHTSRYVDSQHNINTFYFSILPVIRRLRACQYQHYHNKRYDS